MGTVETTIPRVEEAGSRVPESFVWDVPGKSVVIHLRYDAIDRLGLEVTRGFALVPKRGAEVGGILLGTVEEGGPLTVRIEDFEPVPCQHSRGPSFVLSEAEVGVFAEILGRWRRAPGLPIYAVGYYRSHTREGLSLSDYDLALLDAYLPGPSDVALLVKPFATRVSVGGFFFREGGSFRGDTCYREFPFRRKELGGGAPTSARVEREEPSGPHGDAGKPPAPGLYAEADAREDLLRDAEAPDPDEEPPTVPAPDTKSRRGWVWIPLSFVFLLLGTLLGFQAAISLHKPPLQIGEPNSLGLSVIRQDASWEIKWNRQAPAILTSQRGVLSINDGASVVTRELDAKELQDRRVVYGHSSPHMRFRLEVFPGDPYSVSETVEIRSEAPPAAKP